MSAKDPKNIHDFEQMTAMMLDLAQALARYREELEQRGFTREESVQLCISYQSVLLGKRTER